jgi:rhomboid protease GluP
VQTDVVERRSSRRASLAMALKRVTVAWFQHVTMDTEAAGVGPENFPVEYQDKSGSLHNAELRGSGTLTLDPDGGVGVFTGEQRRMFGRPMTVTISFSEIFNVVVVENRIVFDRRGAGPRAKATTFLFFCREPETAGAIAARLPSRKDEEFLAGRDFAHRLARLPVAATWWGSPTNLIIAANVLVFVAMGFLGAGWIETGDMMVYVRYGANNGAVTTDGQWWRLFTSMFLHFGLLHLALNMWALFQVGHLVERLLGRAMYVLAYLGSGLCGGFATLIWNGDRVWSAGASGAVFGIFGVLGGFALRQRRTIPRSVLQPLLKSTLWFAGYNLLWGIAHPHIDNAAHIGGLLGGVVLGGVLAMPVDLEARARLASRRMLAGAALTAVLVAIGFSASPRFNYVLQEELEWEKAIESPLAKEHELLAQQKAVMAAFQNAGKSTELIQWMQEKAIPFYDRWIADLHAMKLTSGKETAQRRDALVGLMRAKIENYRQLEFNVKMGDPDALGRYRRAEDEALQQVRRAVDESPGR